jgi:hypothetical protein
MSNTEIEITKYDIFLSLNVAEFLKRVYGNSTLPDSKGNSSQVRKTAPSSNKVSCDSRVTG